mmetsp:Transcript_43301/g.117291  ORF Transcript_43301/g.117291 Transcript_43301/m.117291 type:complete len:233 (+) Transcript_43301:209-907(+)
MSAVAPAPNASGEGHDFGEKPLSRSVSVCADVSDAGRGESQGSSVRNIFHTMGSRAGIALTRRSLSGLSSDTTSRLTTSNRSKKKIMPSGSPGSGAGYRELRSYTTLSHQASRDTAVQMRFPMFVISVNDFLELDKFEPHQVLRDRGKLLIREEHEQVAEGPIFFFSHQWTSFTEPVSCAPPCMPGICPATRVSTGYTHACSTSFRRAPLSSSCYLPSLLANPPSYRSPPPL